MASISGGKFGSGFISAGVTKYASAYLFKGLDRNNTYDQIQSMVISMAVGGTTSYLTGGKFGNGARTAVYQTAYNFLQVVPGFIIGVVLEVGCQALTGEIQDTSFNGVTKNIGKAFVSGAAGATGAGIASVASKTIASVAGRALANTAAGAAVGGTSTVAVNEINGEDWDKNIVTGITVGGAAGAAGSLVGDAIDIVGTTMVQKSFSELPLATQNLFDHILGATPNPYSNTVGFTEVLSNAVSNSNGVIDSCGLNKQCKN